MAHVMYVCCVVCRLCGAYVVCMLRCVQAMWRICCMYVVLCAGYMAHMLYVCCVVCRLCGAYVVCMLRCVQAIWRICCMYVALCAGYVAHLSQHLAHAEREAWMEGERQTDTDTDTDTDRRLRGEKAAAMARSHTALYS